MSLVDRQIEQQLSYHDVRYTRGRRTVVDALEQADGPRSAAELEQEIPDLPLSSLYRTLAVLEEADIVVPHLSTKGVARYELAEWLAGHHHHLVCVECGRVEDIAVPEQYEAQIHDLVGAISSHEGFTATNHALEIEGRCAACA